MSDQPMSALLQTLEHLDAHNIWYRLEHVRDSIMVLIAFPGERWEVEFFADGHVEVEKFISTGGVVEERDILARIVAADAAEQG